MSRESFNRNETEASRQESEHARRLNKIHKNSGYSLAERESMDPETREVIEHSALRAAKSQLEKETERGEHRPAVGGYADHKHGGES